jgi:hypothetical protein
MDVIGPFLSHPHFAAWRLIPANVMQNKAIAPWTMLKRRLDAAFGSFRRFRDLRVMSALGPNSEVEFAADRL